ncbi:MAG: hypothetical protein JWN14_402, partial [Chthonomonadales bacterium]|nr:hypothetical protein [Chthonomonadales bacterium]
GGALGAAAGLVGLSSGSGGSAAALVLRTPSDIPSVIASTGLGNSAGVPVAVGTGVPTGPSTGIPGGTSVGVPVSPGSDLPGVSVNSLGGGSVLTQTGGTTPSAGGIISNIDPTPEPGTLALLSGMGLMLAAARLRRRKR